MAYVILHPESARRWDGKHAEFSSALRTYARERLPGFATPEWIVVVEELPVCPFITHIHWVVPKEVIASENIDWKDHEDDLAQTSRFRKVMSVTGIQQSIVTVLSSCVRKGCRLLTLAAIHIGQCSASR
jgi:hypothetical protein